MSLPPLTHLQFAVLDVLGSNQGKGRVIRDNLKKVHGIRKTGPAFYQMMARLEEAKFVEGWYSQEIIEGQIIKERNYRILAKGVSAMRATEAFYSRAKAGSLRPAFGAA